MLRMIFGNICIIFDHETFLMWIYRFRVDLKKKIKERCRKWVGRLIAIRKIIRKFFDIFDLIRQF